MEEIPEEQYLTYLSPDNFNLFDDFQDGENAKKGKVSRLARLRNGLAAKGGAAASSGGGGGGKNGKGSGGDDGKEEEGDGLTDLERQAMLNAAVCNAMSAALAKRAVTKKATFTPRAQNTN